jgi:hypothetical protein
MGCVVCGRLTLPNHLHTSQALVEREESAPEQCLGSNTPKLDSQIYSQFVCLFVLSKANTLMA